MKSSSRDEKTPARLNLVTSHGRVLAFIASDPDARLREIAAATEITERRAFEIVNDLEQAGFLKKTRAGRRNRYSLVDRKRVRGRGGQTVVASQLLALLLEVFDQQPFG